MTSARDAPLLDLSFDAPAGAFVRVSPLTRRIVAPNPGAFTFTGTCAYIVGARAVAIVDPGPAVESHVDALLSAIAGERLVAILLTHSHRDHAPAAAALRQRTGAPVLGGAPYAPPRDWAAAGPSPFAGHDRDYRPDRVLQDGERMEIGAATLAAIATPGHAANHFCFALEEERTLFTGDHVMGWATTVIAPPDGAMTAYTDSIEKLRARDDALFWPAHGPPVQDPQRRLRMLVNHRRAREAAILRRLEAGDATIAQMVAHIYAGFDARLQSAAALNLYAHLEDLVARGAVAAPQGCGLFARYVKL